MAACCTPAARLLGLGLSQRAPRGLAAPARALAMPSPPTAPRLQHRRGLAARARTDRRERPRRGRGPAPQQYRRPPRPKQKQRQRPAGAPSGLEVPNVTVMPAGAERTVFGATTFSHAGLSDPGLLHAMDELGFTACLSVQERVIPRVLQGEDVVLASQTGSGKTLAYLLPVLQQLKARQDGAGNPVRKAHQPTAIVVAPVRELVDQILGVARELARHCKIKALAAHSASRPKRDWECDLLVATPAMLSELLAGHRLSLASTRCLVFDEADTLLSADNVDDSLRLLAACRSDFKALQQAEEEEKALWAPLEAQCIFACATLTVNVQSLSRVLPTLETLRVPGLHRPPQGLHHYFDFCSVDTKLDKTVQLLRQPLPRGEKQMVFCNSASTAFFLSRTLAEHGIDALLLTGSSDSEERLAVFSHLRDEKHRSLLVCTNLAARGLDNRNVTRIINYDFPRDGLGYLHRAGRCGRAGSKGQVYSFATRKERTAARAVKAAIQEGRPIHLSAVG